MKIKVTVEIEVPDKATHYHGDLLDSPSFYYCSQVGVAGDHWWGWREMTGEWVLVGHHKPHWIEELPSRTPRSQKRRTQEIRPSR